MISFVHPFHLIDPGILPGSLQRKKVSLYFPEDIRPSYLHMKHLVLIRNIYGRVKVPELKQIVHVSVFEIL